MKKVIFILLFFCSVQVSLHAQWQSCSPFDTVTVNCLTSSGTNMFAGTDGNGIYMSPDSGSNWVTKNTGLSNMNIKAIACDTSGNLFAGSNSLFLFTSSDTGNNWTSHNVGGTGTAITSIAFSGANIFAGELLDGIFMSSDNGGTWTEKGLCCASVLSVFADTNGYVYAGTNSTVNRSSGAFTSWTPLNGGIPLGTVRAIIKSGTLFFAGTYGNGVFVSADDGSHWSAVNAGLSDLKVFSLAAAGTKLFAGTDGGGVFISVDSGNNWLAVNEGLNHLNVPSLAIHGTTIFAGTGNGGVWKRPLAELTGINKSDASFKFNVYPVPASDFICIETQDMKNTNAEILSIDGRQIMTQVIKDQRTEIKISGLPAGIYLIKINNDEGSGVKKFIKE